MATTDSRIEMHVFGAGKGESVVLRLPTGAWGVIDCYASDLGNPARNPICNFLAEQDVKELEFLCLTHPHDDHFRGMSHLLESFRVRYFWRPGVMSGEKLKWLLKLANIDAKRSGDETAIENVSELERIFTAVRKARKRRREPLIPKNAVVATQLYPVPVDPTSGLQIWAVAPSGRRCDAYEERLRKCFDAAGHFNDTLGYSHHNEISMALLVKFGGTSLVLGGDVEESGWKDTIEEFGVDRLTSNAVKVSHHGSCNGYCDGLWKGFSVAGPPIAVITPYHQHRLPRDAALVHIGDFASRITTPCLAAIQSSERPIPLSTKVPAKSRKALHEKFKATASATYSTGRCSFIFDDVGNCIGEELAGPAGVISLDGV